MQRLHRKPKEEMEKGNGKACWDSLVDQRVKRLPAMQETRVRSLGQEDPLETKIEKTLYMDIMRWSTPKSD